MLLETLAVDELAWHVMNASCCKIYKSILETMSQMLGRLVGMLTCRSIVADIMLKKKKKIAYCNTLMMCCTSLDSVV